MNNKNQRTNIIAIGGGHGLGRMLSALNECGDQVTGIVTTTDNGGSTGRIRACQDCIAWGDTRNCLNQLITEPSIGSMIFEYRFKGNSELNGHNLGNLMLTALDNMSIRPLEAINLIRNMLNVSTHIIPMSEYPADLIAQTHAGQIISGETNIDNLKEPPALLMLKPIVPATKEAIQAINDAKLVILGPGSFLTSVMPPLLLPEINRALECTPARIIFVRNLSKEAGPAKKMTLSTILKWCERSMGGRKINLVLGPDNDETIEEVYQQVSVDLASVSHQWRHDRDKLSQAIKEILLGDE
ncbi:uridine diphosphate-N-acetylglucosamine-binding protein YvcK [Candidatus Enterovibrio altilux]|uniref:Putative gluconeogenesis factor n=1 Tax=Candidatus Enterovibrio altilux TaxID=1927128 RepID=A0A291B6Y9_9GAMM|nr:uridine diphosphate-N-acetylglucosamine-binding protein YvcK [Candidatus Enterovibrio luxaltus]ATF08774.1 2-phospho-L-lactate transferase [Candidatus Enterovibrio luxaltus]